MHFEQNTSFIVEYLKENADILMSFKSFVVVLLKFNRFCIKTSDEKIRFLNLS